MWGKGRYRDRLDQRVFSSGIPEACTKGVRSCSVPGIAGVYAMRQERGDYWNEESEVGTEGANRQRGKREISRTIDLESRDWVTLGSALSVGRQTGVVTTWLSRNALGWMLENSGLSFRLYLFW